MITVQHLRQKLIKFVLFLAVLVGLVAIGVDSMRQAQAITRESEITNRWLKGEIKGIDDSALQELWRQLQTKLKGFDKDLSNPSTTDCREGAGKEKILIDDGKLPLSGAERPYKDFWPETTVFYKYSQLVVSKGVSLTEQQDIARYVTIMCDIAENPATDPTAEEKGPAAYSARMMNYFEISEHVKQRLPGLSIRFVYVASNKGSLAIYPHSNVEYKNRDGGYDLFKRPWYTSIQNNKPATPEYVVTENGLEDKTYSLGPAYIDYVFKDYVRTFCHTYEGNGTKYFVCVDLVLAPKAVHQYSINFFGLFPFEVNYANEVGVILHSLSVGIVSGVAFFCLGLAVIWLRSTWSTNLAMRVISQNISPRKTETGNKFRPLFKEFAAQMTQKIEHITTGGTSNTKSTRFALQMTMKIFRFDHEREQITESTDQHIISESIERESLNNALLTRGLEKWEIYRSQGHWIGCCRLCGQEVKYHDTKARVGDAIIRHRIPAKPEVDLRIDPHDSHTNTDLKPTIIWQALGKEAKKLGQEYELEAYPAPQIPSQVQKLDFAKDLLESYRLLNEGRYETNNCVALSKKSFRDRNVRATCKISYLMGVINAGKEALEALQVGNNIERTLVADTKEEMAAFLSQHGDILSNLLAQKNQQLFTISLDNMPVDVIKTYPELDFALVSDADFTFVLVSNMNEHTQGGPISGYLSWREFDTRFFETLYEFLEQFRKPLTLDAKRLKTLGEIEHE